jgi:hypothetical protein
MPLAAGMISWALTKPEKATNAQPATIQGRLDAQQRPRAIAME